MMKKSNKKGFTLVELVVVVAIFGIILGTILNFIKPANELHNDVQSTMDANIISSGLIEYMDDELRYATNVLVLENYAGVPQVSATGQVGTCTTPFTHCLVIDNNNLRGYGLKSYTADLDTTAKKIGATGCVYKVNKLAEGGFNFNNASVVKGVDFYDKFKFDISVGTNVTEVKADATLRTLQVNVVTYEPEYKNGDFVFEKKKFDRDTVYSSDDDKKKSTGAILNLTNINIQKGGEFDLRGDMKCDDPVLESIVATKYPNAPSAPAGATSFQQKYYNTADENRYTYVFYQKKSNASASKCEVKLVYSNDHPVSSLQGKEIGTTRYVTKGATFKTFPSVPSLTGYLPPKWLAPDGSSVDTSKGYVITESTIFTLVYTPETSIPMYDVTWLDTDGSEFTKNKAFENYPPESPGTPPGVDTEKQDFLGWYRQGTGEEYSTIKITGNGVVFVPKVKNKWKVEFTSDEAGASVIAANTIYVSDGQTATAPADTPAAPTGKQFDKWVVKGHTDQEISTTNITANTVFVPTFKDKPPVPSGASVLKLHFRSNVESWGNVIQIAGNNVDVAIKDNLSRQVLSYKNVLENKLGNGKSFEFTFYSTELPIIIQWTASETFANNGTVYERWYKDGKLYASDPG